MRDDRSCRQAAWRMQALLEPFTAEDCAAIRAHIDRLAREERYRLDRWGLAED